MAAPDTNKHLLHGSLDVLILSILADGPQYGYALQQKLKAASDHELKAGTLYPLLHRLEVEGLVEPTWEKTTGRPRKWYALTPAGRRRLTRAAADWQAAIARMQAVVLPALRQATRFPDAHPIQPPEPA